MKINIRSWITYLCDVILFLFFNILFLISNVMLVVMLKYNKMSKNYSCYPQKRDQNVLFGAN